MELMPNQTTLTLVKHTGETYGSTGNIWKHTQVSEAQAHEKAEAKRAKRLKTLLEADKKARDKVQKLVDGAVDDSKRFKRLSKFRQAIAAQVSPRMHLAVVL